MGYVTFTWGHPEDILGTTRERRLGTGLEFWEQMK